LLINLTPCIPLSTLGEGEVVLKEGLTPLLDTWIKWEIGGITPEGGRVGRKRNVKKGVGQSLGEIKRNPVTNLLNQPTLACDSR